MTKCERVQHDGNIRIVLQKTHNFTGLTLADYAAALGLPLASLEALGLRTIDNPYAANRNAVAIPYRRTDGSFFRDRIWQALPVGDAKTKRIVWDKRTEKLGGILYGPNQLPAEGCPVILVDNESWCHTLWHHGFDAISTAGPSGYHSKRDDPQLEHFDVSVIAGNGARRGELLKRLSSSNLRPFMKLATIPEFPDLQHLHQRAAERFTDVLGAALAAAEPLDAILAREPELDAGRRKRKNDGDGTIADKLVGLARNDAVFFIAPDDTAWAAITVNGHRETWEASNRAGSGSG